MSIKVENLTYIYDEGMPFEHRALDDVSFEIQDRDFVGLIGHTGSGKSTLIQHLNGLMKPSSGKIYINGFDRVRKAMADVGLDYDHFSDKSPFELSGGQKRRVAIAGVIAMEPEVLILDEPTAGLDPGGRDEIFDLIRSLHANNNMTVILSSHSMDDMAKLVNTLMVMNKGRLEIMGSPREVFKENADRLRGMGLNIPQVLELAIKLKKAGYDVRTDVITIEEVKAEIERCLLEKGGSTDA